MNFMQQESEYPEWLQDVVDILTDPELSEAEQIELLQQILSEQQ